jgi:hypothetical protein
VLLQAGAQYSLLLRNGTGLPPTRERQAQKLKPTDTP